MWSGSSPWLGIYRFIAFTRHSLRAAHAIRNPASERGCSETKYFSDSNIPVQQKVNRKHCLSSSIQALSISKHSIRGTWLKVRCIWVQLQLLKLHFQQVWALLEPSGK